MPGAPLDEGLFGGILLSILIPMEPLKLQENLKLADLVIYTLLPQGIPEK